MSVPKQRNPFMRPRYPATTWTAAAILVQAVAWFVFHTWWIALMPVATLALVWTYRRYFRSQKRIQLERQRQLELRDGWATPLDLVLNLGYPSIRRQLKVLRPLLAADLSQWQRLWVPAYELGIRLVQITGWLGKRWLYVPVEKSTAIMGPAGQGKSGLIGAMGLEHQGPAVFTSVKDDLIRNLRELKSTVGPTYVFNPQGLGGAEARTTIRFNPLIGCKRYETAKKRAGQMVAGSSAAKGVGGEAFWNDQAVRVLALYLHAAALDGHSMIRVYEWIAGANESEEMQAELRDALAEAPHLRAMLADAGQWLRTNERTASSSTTMVTHAVSWLGTDAAAAADCKPEESFDVRKWLAGNGTLFLLGEASEESTIAPLFTAFIGYVIEEMKAYASEFPTSRLERAAALFLDEIANLVPLANLPELVATLRAFNISLHLGVQSPVQLEEKWGEKAAAIIMDNLAVEMYTGGFKNPEILNRLTMLFGEVTTRFYNPATNRTESESKPVLAPAQIRGLKKGELLLVAQGIAGATIGVFQAYWERADHKAWVKAGRKGEHKRRFALGGRREPKAIAATAAPLPTPAAEAAWPEVGSDTVPQQRPAFDTDKWMTRQFGPEEAPEGDAANEGGTGER